MITLGIETSCDETSCAILENGSRIRSNIISSSLAKHKPFGGVVPEIASRHCLEAIDYVYKTSLRQAKIKPEVINLIAVTQGPGLIGSLLVGVSFAKSLSFALGKPLVGVHHLEAHLASNFILRSKPRKPYLGLVVSGGHTSLVMGSDPRSNLSKGSDPSCSGYEELGSTVDDAIGEAYDKTAKILGLGYPGGPVIDQLAQEGNPGAYSFTKPKVDGKFDFSFSGIKTAVLHLVNGNGKVQSSANVWKGRKLKDVCASFQLAVTDWILQKTLSACEEKGVTTIVIGGGVSANSRLRSIFAEECHLRGYELFIPPLDLTLDNAAMVARLGFECYKKGRRSDWDLAASPCLAFGAVGSACYA